LITQFETPSGKKSDDLSSLAEEKFNVNSFIGTQTKYQAPRGRQNTIEKTGRRRRRR
jgi:hypothetical protein